jgi:hypothetical protein
MRLMRLKHKPKRLIPEVCYDKDGKAYSLDTAEYVGELFHYGMYEAHGEMYDRLEVKLPNGTLVPAYRRSCVLKDRAIRQDFSHHAIGVK